MTNREQAKVLLETVLKRGLRFPEHTCNDCPGLACLQPLMFGRINLPAFPGDDILWGPHGSGNLFGDWDYRSEKLVSLRGVFRGPEPFDPIIEDYSDLL
jgi:hypothetical protein